MPSDQTRVRPTERQIEPINAEADPAGPSPLLEQAQAWANVAREAHENCVRGDEAEQMLRQRRNTSGQ